MFWQHSGQAGTGVAISSLDLSWEVWEIREAFRDDIQLFVMGALGWTQRPPLFSLRDEHILSHQYKRVPGQSLFSGRSSGMEHMHVFSRWWPSLDLPPLVKPKVMSKKSVVATSGWVCPSATLWAGMDSAQGSSCWTLEVTGCTGRDRY